MAEFDAGALFGVKGLIVVVTGGGSGSKSTIESGNRLNTNQELG